MRTTPQAYVSHMMEMARTRNWEELPELHREIYQDFADALDWGGLESFFREALEVAAPIEVWEVVNKASQHLPRIVEDLAVALDKAVEKAAKDSEIRGLYCEFFYDGGDASTIDVFPCTRFDRNDDFWASEFRDVIAGSLVQHYFRYDPEEKLEPLIDLIADQFLQAKLFAALGYLVGDRVKGIPFAFAKHDDPIIYVGTCSV